MNKTRLGTLWKPGTKSPDRKCQSCYDEHGAAERNESGNRLTEDACDLAGMCETQNRTYTRFPAQVYEITTADKTTMKRGMADQKPS